MTQMKDKLVTAESLKYVHDKLSDELDDMDEAISAASALKEVIVSGTTPNITGVSNTRYKCGEVTSISITPPQTGSIDVIFLSGSPAATLTLPNTVIMPAWFDSTQLQTNTAYEINIKDGVYGVVMSWAI